MKQDSKNGTNNFVSIKTAMALSLLIFVIAIGASAFKKEDVSLKEIKLSTINRDSIESVKAFETVYKTLMSQGA